MEDYETIMNSTRAPFSILPRAIDTDGNTVVRCGLPGRPHAEAKTATLPRPSSNRTVGGFVAQFGLSSLCMRTPMAQAPDGWLTALQRWAGRAVSYTHLTLPTN